MNWNAIGAIAELIGALAVVATLLYLATQIRQNVVSLRNSGAWAINEGLAVLNGRVSTDAEFADIWMRGLENADSLNAVERERFRAFCMDMLNLAVYAQAVSKGAGSAAPAHFDVVQVFGGYYQQYPGFRQMVDAVEVVTPADLMVSFRNARPLTGTETYGVRSDA
jgi:hypothetical protein